MKIGLQIPKFTWPGGPANLGATLADIARTAEAVGFDSLWVMDHFFQLPALGSADEPMLEGYSALGFLAAVTARVRLGTMVTGVIYRHPGHLIKSVSTLDVISGGRATLGIGAAWYEREALGLGFPFPSLKERFERLEEVLQIAHHMWSGSAEPFNGQHYRLAEPLNRPQPLTKPHPPILVGGGGEQKTLRLVAQYADACNLSAFAGTDALARKLDVLRRHCEDVGRPYDEIERTAIARINLAEQTPLDVIDTCRFLADLGFQHFIFSLADGHKIEPLEVIGREVIPAVAAL